MRQSDVDGQRRRDATSHEAEGMPPKGLLAESSGEHDEMTSSCSSDCHQFGKCAVLGARPLSVRHFASLALQHEYLDPRACSSVALLAYASAGALPHPESAALRRHDDMHGSQEFGRAAGSTGLSKSAEVIQATQCAVCRLCAHELWLTVLLARRCGVSTQESLEMLSAAPSSLCAHMEATGMLGHHQITINWFRAFCDELIDANEERLSRLLTRALRLGGEHNATSLALELCSARACKRSSAAGELFGWPGALQLLLDGAAETLLPTLKPGGRASDILEGKPGRLRWKHAEAGDTNIREKHKGCERGDGKDSSDSRGSIGRDSGSETDADGAEGGSGDGSAAAALLLLGAVRSDTLLVKMLCAFGVCSRPAVDDVGRRMSLAAALPNERDKGLLLDALSLSVPASRLRLFSEKQIPSPDAQSTHLAPTSEECRDPSHKGRLLSASFRRLRNAAQWRLQLHWATPTRLAAVHAAAYLLEAETLQLLLHAAPDAAALRDSAGRTPLHYVAAGTDRVLGSVYLFTKQEGLRTWLRGRTAGAVDFAPQHTGANLTTALQDAQMAAAAELLEAGADAAAADKQGLSPFHMAAASGCFALLKRLWCSVGDREARASMLSAKAFDGRDARALAAAGGHAATLRWLSALWTAGCGSAGKAGPQILGHLAQAQEREAASAVGAEAGTEAELQLTAEIETSSKPSMPRLDVSISAGPLADTSTPQPLSVPKGGTDGTVLVGDADSAASCTPRLGALGAQSATTDGAARERADPSVTGGVCPSIEAADPDYAHDAECERDRQPCLSTETFLTRLALGRHSLSQSAGCESSLFAVDAAAGREIARKEAPEPAASVPVTARGGESEVARIHLSGNEMSTDAAYPAGEGDRNCDLPIEHSANLTADSFRRDYVLTGRPLLLRGVTNDWPAIELLQADSFRRNYADVDWQPQYLLRGNATNLRRYLHRVATKRVRRPLAFNRPLDAAVQSQLRAHVRWPTPMAHPRLRAHSHIAPAGHGESGGSGDGGGALAAAGLDFFAGPALSGIPMHYHGPVWNALVYGRKLWALLPPSESRFAPEQQHPLDSDWYRTWRLRSKADSANRRRFDGGERPPWRFCVQEEGDALYVPLGWGHATLNLREGLAVGGFLHDALSLGLHMQVQHAPRGVGSLQNAAVWGDSWRRLCSRAFALEA